MDQDKAISLVDGYSPTDEAKELVKNTNIALVVGATHTGQNAIIQRLFRSGNYTFIVSHTTRTPREKDGVKERDGEHYFFIDWAKATDMLESKKFIEAKVLFGSTISGTSVAEIKRVHDSGKTGVTDVDVQGVEEYKNISEEIHAIYILPSSFDRWIGQLTSSGEFDQNELQTRLKAAEDDLERAIDVGYFHFVVNHDLDVAAKQIHEIVESSESENTDKPPHGADNAWKLLGELKHHLSS